MLPLRRLTLALLLFFLPLSLFSQSFTYSPGPQLAEARVGHRSAVLPNGKVLVMGGDNGIWTHLFYYNSCSLYNPISNSFEQGAPMHTPRSYFMSVTLNNGNVMAMGGDNKNDFAIKSCEIFQHATNTWQVADSLQVSHLDGAAVRLNGGRVLVAGGITQKCEVYDAALNTWSFVGDMNTVHGRGMTLTLLQNGMVLAVGGINDARSAELFSPVTNTWTSLPVTTLYYRYFHTAVLLNDGKVLLAGSAAFSTDDQIKTEYYDPSNRSFFPAGDLTTNASNDEMVVLDNGHVVMFGIGDPFSASTKNFQEYDPISRTWSTGFYSSIGASGYTVNRLNNGDFLFIAGNFTTGNGAINGTVMIRQKGYETCIPPDLSTTLTASAPSVCIGKAQSFTLSKSEDQAVYSAYLGDLLLSQATGNGGSLALQVPSFELAQGDNLVTVKVSKAGCPLKVLSNKVTLKSTPALTSPTSIFNTKSYDLLCATPDATLKIRNPSGTYLWSTGETGDSIKITKETVATARLIDANGCLGPISNTIALRKLKPDELKVEYLTRFCETSGPIQLEGAPLGGTWSGSGVSSSGIITPSSLPVGTYEMTYRFCEYSAIKKVEIQANNTVETGAASINWSGKDTVCAGLSYPFLLEKYNMLYRYELYWDKKLFMSSKEFDGSFYYEFKPTLETKADFELIVTKFIPSSACPRDSAKSSTHFTIIPRTSFQEQIIFPDTVCSNMPVKVKVVHPSPSSAYYIAPGFSSFPGLKVQNTTGVDTLEVVSPPAPYESNASFSVFVVPGYGCASIAPPTVLKGITIGIVNLASKVEISKNYFPGEEITGPVTSNGNYFKWNIDGVAYSGKALPVLSYANPGHHSYHFISTSRYGCSDTLTKEVYIIKKPALPASSLCLFDTLPFPSSSLLFQTLIDKKGNTLYVGAKGTYYYPYGHSAFLYKYSKSGKVLWSYEHDRYKEASPSNFNSFFITAATLDENDNLYITGNYSSTQITLLGTVIKHPESNLPYMHAFVAKISESGKLEWIISSSYEKSEYGYLATPYALGGADIKYAQNMLYVSAKIDGQLFWSNHLGQKIALENGSAHKTHVILKIPTTGTQVRVVAGFDIPLYSQYNLGHIFNPPGNGGVIVNQQALTGPKVHFLPENKLAVEITTRTDLYFGSTIYSPYSDPYQLPYTELTATLDLKTETWDSIRYEGASDTYSPYGSDSKKVVFTSEGHRLSTQSSEGYAPLGGESGNIWLSSTEKLQASRHFSLLKRIDKEGNLIWKKTLTGALVHHLFLSSDESQLIVMGTYRLGIDIGFGDEEYGLGNAVTSDLFAMGFNATTGDLVWSEKIGMANLDDIFSSAALSPCNELLLVGSRQPYFNPSDSYTTYREKDKIEFKSDVMYAVRIPTTGLCNAANCGIVTSLATTTSRSSFAAQLFPNPASQSFTLKAENGASCQKVTIRNLQGISVKTLSIANEITPKVDLSDLASGLYTVEAIFGEKTSVNKLSVVR